MSHPSPAQLEAARLDALRKLDLLDTPPNEAFDRITRMAAQLFKLPIAAVSLTDVDRQWFKSRVGVDHCAIPREKAPCGEVANTARMLVVPDLLLDACYRDSHLAASGVRFYAGAPLVTRDGYGLGALCVLGTEPRTISETERTGLADLAAMVMAQIELQHAIGRVDPVSGIPNRTQFVDDLHDLALERPEGEARLAALVNLATPGQISSAVCAMGAGFVDDIIREAARMLRAALGPARKLYHVGPSQFAFLAEPGADLARFCEWLSSWIALRLETTTARFVTTATVGVVPFATGRADALDLLRDMYSAAHDAIEGSHRVRVFSAEQNAVFLRRFRVANDFGAALADDSQLRLVFQPKIELGTGRCIGAEALLRWRHPELGEISPGEFIPVIEQTSLARAATRWVLERALRQLAEWRRAGLALQVAINVSAVNLLEPDFCGHVLARLQAWDLPPGALAIEITESALMSKRTLAASTLDALAAGGVQLAIDDFGTGYSSLAYLQSMPAKVVKIDQSFIRELDVDERKRALVATMIKLAHELGQLVVAEGVETAQVAHALAGAGCDQVQGYLYAKPLAPEQFEEWICAKWTVARPRTARQAALA
ncbi:bifunctional diguanylate cyclase/phosphodiesterase [Massilia sp. Mn16-1_5]|uniref:putative bifunctional diguanylate cyclase/phosphodiesterase n=1 Tax=Massilia sp. Mn16-1_5 TaxID=2079199 RepID=UPI00109EAFFD|nr:sensor domain-containing phosphodiesterase [Massilia sp. Mn16-1_5]THC40969.1 sensor domain-containing phosphodiesterase [Massilia sp. Mn16-1_5]